MPISKLNDRQRKIRDSEIYRKYNSGATVKQLSDLFNVSTATIYRILNENGREKKYIKEDLRSFQSIADELGITEPQAYASYNNGIKKLKKYIKDSHIDTEVLVLFECYYYD